MELTTPNGRLRLDPRTGYVKGLSLAGGATRVHGDAGAGLFEVALPLPDYAPHRIRLTEKQVTPVVEKSRDTVRISYGQLRSDYGEFALEAEVIIRGESEAGFSLRMTLTNNTRFMVPQVLFPNLVGLEPTGKVQQETLRFGRGKVKPYSEWNVPDGAAKFYDLHRRRYFDYQSDPFCMKWFDLGNRHQGLTVFSKDLTPDAQGIYLEKWAEADRLRLSWAHYPHVAPGETWQSPEFVLYPHEGGWEVGVKPYKDFIAAHFKTAAATEYLRGTPGLRTLFFSSYLFGEKPNFRYRDLPQIGRDSLKHGVREIVVWFWNDNLFDLPFRLDRKLGSEAELREALAACRKMGVNVSAFLSCRGIRADCAPEEWFEHDVQGNKRYQFYTYSLDFVPPFNPPYYNSGVSSFICPASKGWQKAFLGSCRELHRWGFSSICFDQLFARGLCYNKEHNHKPQQTGRAFYDILQKAIKDGRRVDPEATFSGEYFTEITQAFQHYNWDWNGGAERVPEDFAPFRHVFPQFRVGFLVDRSLRWLLEAFTHGLYINFFPEGGEGLIGTDKAFSLKVRQLTRLRGEFRRFLESGEYFGSTPVEGQFPCACLYRSGLELLLIVTNPKAQTEDVKIAMDLSPFLAEASRTCLNVYDAEGGKGKAQTVDLPCFTFEGEMAPHEMLLLHFHE